ncbi:rhamnan synthesis F family protein [Photobacterium leiognathi]|uniref:rhamnan synthesis F family protein n=1 Tax=Photobacterium leiognathi TaxID=553611 RepID=UPI002981A6D6|nr:rhamnan synthesis F family protein [Photobacterium leiognathi]
MKHLAIFAGFNQDNILTDDTFFYISELSKFYDVIVVFDNALNNNDLVKLNEICLTVIAKRHGLYDFGSYKIGIDYAKKNINIEEYSSILIANDSVFMVGKDIKKVVNQYNPNGNIDFWGVYYNTMERYLGGDYHPHIQSYFVIFGSKIIRSKSFYEFFDAIKKEKSKIDIINKYEIGMTKFFLKRGFTCSSLITRNRNDTVSTRSLFLLLKGFPFLKKSAFKENIIVRLIGYYVVYINSPEVIRKAILINNKKISKIEVLKISVTRIIKKVRSKICI